jgi:hypothetical protein
VAPPNGKKTSRDLQRNHLEETARRVFGPITFFNAAQICASVEDDFTLPFPSFLRLRMAFIAESLASSSSD